MLFNHKTCTGGIIGLYLRKTNQNKVMKNLLLLTTLAVGLTASANVQPTELQKTVSVEKQIPVKLSENIERARKMRIEKIHGLNKTINPELRKNRRNAAPEAPEGYRLFEDFESWDGSDESWLPEGWTIDHKDSPASNRGWKMTQQLDIYDIIDSKCMTYETFDDEVDEWLITPEFEVGPGMELHWATMTSPYFYDISFSDAVVSQPEEYPIMNDIRVNISTDGGKTWELLYSHAEELIKETDGNFFAMFNYNVRPFEISLNKYAGNKVQIGFQIWGREGSTTFIDDVSVGLPPTGSAYSRPQSHLFFGLSNFDANVPKSIMVGPVFSPVKYTNTTPGMTAKTFNWSHVDSQGVTQTSTDRHLTVTYTTDYTNESTTRNNVYDFPVLQGRSDNTAPDSFTYDGWYQAGGKAQYQIYYSDTQEYELIDLGLTVIDPVTEGSATYADIALPYFGYNQESDRYWSEKSFKDEVSDENWSHLEKIGDLFFTPETPLVIEGVRMNAYGKVTRNAKFTADIYLVNAGFVIPDTPFVTATCTGNNITMIDRGGSNDFLSLNFKFDEPIVISKDVSPYFFVAIGGFRDADNVEYFSPEMSNYDNPNELALGWLGHQLSYEGSLLPFSWTDVYYNAGNHFVSFYIMLDASFPWLVGDTDELEIEAGASAAVTLDSFYDASSLKVEGMPEWLTATAKGRYGNTQVTFTAIEAASGSANVKITAPGVSKEVKITSNPSGISSIVSDNHDEAAEIYTITGHKVTPENMTPGLYVIRYKNGTSKKFIHK